MEPTTTEIFGTEGIDLKTHCAHTRNHIAEARDHNAGLACLVRELQALSLRRSNDHPNPYRLYRKEPVPLLEIRDKVAGPWVPWRGVPVTGRVSTLVEKKCYEWFGDIPWLPYSWEGRLVAFHKLPKHERKRLGAIINDEDQRNSGRTALYNATWRRGVGEVIRQVIFAHGSLSGHPYAGLLPISLKRLLEIARPPLETIFKEDGIDSCADELIAMLDRVLDKKILEAARDNPPLARNTKTREKLTDVPEGIHPPLEYEEYKEYIALFDRLSTFFTYGAAGRKGANKWRKHAPAVMGLISFLLGIPLKHLLRYQAYYSYDSFVIDATSGQIYFLVVGGHHDRGGLYRFPVRVCSTDEVNSHPVMLLIHSLLAQRIARRSRRAKAVKASRSAMADPLFGTERWDAQNVGAGLGFAFAHNGRCSLTDHEVFNRANRLSEHKCVCIHPALLAANWSGRNLLGLNHYHIPDLLSYHSSVPVRLTDLSGMPWTDRLAADYVKANRLSEEVATVPKHNSGAEEWFHYCRVRGISPSVQGIQQILIDGGVETNAARSQAAQIFELYGAQGFLHCSAPLPLLSAAEARETFEETRQFLEKRFRAKMHGRNANMQDITIEHIQAEMSAFLGLLDRSSARPKEIWDLRVANAIVVNDTGYILVVRGKTAAARRLIELLQSGRTDFDLRLYRNSKDEEIKAYWLPALHAHYSSKNNKYSAIKSIANALSKNSSKVALSSYYLRHHGLISRIEEIVRTKIANGNFWSALSSVSVSAGHGSLLVTLCTYLGAAVFVLETPPMIPGYPKNA